MIKNISIVFIVFSLTACAQFDGSFLNSNDPMTEQLSDDVSPEVHKKIFLIKSMILQVF